MSKAGQTLTQAAASNAAPDKLPGYLWDGPLPGFGVRVYASGKRSFVYRYRLPQQRRVFEPVIGACGELTVVEARRTARLWAGHVAAGHHPVRTMREPGQAEAIDPDRTVAALVQHYLEALRSGHVTTTRSRNHSVTSGYVIDTARHLERFAVALGPQDASLITKAEIQGLLAECAGRPATHRLRHGSITRLYTWAREQGHVSNRPTEDIATGTPDARQRVLSLDELASIWRAAAQLDHVYRDCVQIMILTGQRRQEVADMAWGEVQLGAGLWILPARRTKARRQHSVPLAPLALAILKARHNAFTREPAATDMVLPTLARDGKTVAAISGWNWLKRELDRLSGVTEWRLHDFRRSIVSISAEHGIADVATLDTLLNHASSVTRGGVIGVYQRAALLRPMRAALEAWEALLRTALELPLADQPALLVPAAAAV
jgi:integrase